MLKCFKHDLNVILVQSWKIISGKLSSVKNFGALHSICLINKLKKVVVRPKYLTAGQGIF